MKMFFKILGIVFTKQILFLISFIFIAESNGDFSVKLFIPTGILILYLIAHFTEKNTICENLMIDKTLYNVYGFILWIIVGILLTITSFLLVEIGVLGTGYGFLVGLEYILVPVFLAGYLIVLCILKVIVFIINLLKQ